jgi:recombinase/recombinase-like zinc beta ribbon protein
MGEERRVGTAEPVEPISSSLGLVAQTLGEVLLHPDEAVVTAIRTIFDRFAEMGSARRVWLRLRDQRLKLPLQMHARADIRWVEASYHAVHQVLANPVYAGAYVYGKTRTQVTLDAAGVRKKRIRQLPREEWQVLLKEHHAGYIDWQTYEANQRRIAKNTRPGPHKVGGAVREGDALLQGLASCGHCGRRLRTHYTGRTSSPGYHCSGEHLVEGRGSYCLNIGAVQIDAAVARAFIAALEPVRIAATLAAAEQLEVDREGSLKHWRLGVERAQYAADLAERRYRAVDPDNRLVARGLEKAWEKSLGALETAKAELCRREQERPRVRSGEERSRIAMLGADLADVWNAATTTPRDRKELLGTLIEEVILKVERDKSVAHLTLRWRGGALTDIDVALPVKRQAAGESARGPRPLPDPWRPRASRLPSAAARPCSAAAFLRTALRPSSRAAPFFRDAWSPVRKPDDGSSSPTTRHARPLGCSL